MGRPTSRSKCGLPGSVSGQPARLVIFRPSLSSFLPPVFLPFPVSFKRRGGQQAPVSSLPGRVSLETCLVALTKSGRLVAAGCPVSKDAVAKPFFGGGRGPPPTFPAVQRI